MTVSISKLLLFSCVWSRLLSTILVWDRTLCPPSDMCFLVSTVFLPAQGFQFRMSERLLACTFQSCQIFILVVLVSHQLRLSCGKILVSVYMYTEKFMYFQNKKNTGQKLYLDSLLWQFKLYIWNCCLKKKYSSQDLFLWKKKMCWDIVEVLWWILNSWENWHLHITMKIFIQM